jgi:membrane protease YdiL (CAAX protease family)
VNKGVLPSLFISLGLFVICVFREDVFSEKFGSPLNSLYLYLIAIILIALTWSFLKPGREILGGGWGRENKAFRWFFVVLGILFVAWCVILGIHWQQQGAPTLNGSSLGREDLYAFFFIVLIVPILEEMVFRGILQGSLEKIYPAFAAMLIVALAFALLHNSGEPALEVCLGSLAMSFLRYKTKVLWPCLLLHILGNAAIFFQSNILIFGA